MPARFRALAWTLALITIAVTAYVVRLQGKMVDFDVYRTAGARVMVAEPLYRADDGHYQFKYFPAFALVMMPFAAMDRDVAKPVWFGLSVALLVVFVRSSVRALPHPRLASSALRWLAVLLMAKFYAHELLLGQTNILLGTLLVAALVALQRQRRTLAGALVGLSVFVKPYALVLLPWLAVSGGLSALLSGTAVVLAGLVAPAAVYGWTGNLSLLADWYRTVTETTAPNLLLAENVSFGSLWAKWIGAGALAEVLAVVTALAAFAVVLATWTRRRGVDAPEYLEFAQLMLLVPLVSPQGWDYVLLLATPAVVLLVDRLPAMPWPWRAVTIAGFALMSFTIYDLLGRSLYLWSMSIGVVTVAALMLTTSLMHLRLRAVA